VLSALDVINKDRNRISFKGYATLLKQSEKYISGNFAHHSQHEIALSAKYQEVSPTFLSEVKTQKRIADAKARIGER
jgi:hypothetical protein